MFTSPQRINSKIRALAKIQANILTANRHFINSIIFKVLNFKVGPDRVTVIQISDLKFLL